LEILNLLINFWS